MCKQKVYLAGIGMGTGHTMTQEVKEAVRSSEVIIGAKRMTEPFLKDGKIIVNAYQPEEIAAYLSRHPDITQISVVLSGDAGFYSGAKKLKEALCDSDVEVLPGISSIAYFAAKLQTSWDDAKLISLHGVKQNLIYEVTHHVKTFVLLGQKGYAAQICEKLNWYGLANVNCTIGKNLSYQNEQIVTKKAGQLVPEDLQDLAVMLIENEHAGKSISPHMPDELFIRGQVPMTKEEVRAVSIAKLQLTKNAVVYDIGAGTGSVAVEAARHGADIKVYAIEKNPEGTKLIRTNKRLHCVDNLIVIEGTAPQALAALEPPTHVFIGGSSGNLKEILTCVHNKNKEVRVVINAISLETVAEMTELMKAGIIPQDTQVTQVSVAKSRLLGSYHMMQGQNPVYIAAF